MNATLELSKLIKKPDRFNGDKEKWRDFKMDFINMMAGVDKVFLDELRQAELLDEPIVDGENPEVRQRSISLYSILCSYTCDSAKTIGLELSESHNGFEYWRKL